LEFFRRVSAVGVRRTEKYFDGMLI
jgi:hypothetical protein